MVAGSAPAFSGDGRMVTYVARADPNIQVLVAPVTSPDKATAVRTGVERADAPALSADGSRVPFR